MTKFLCYGGRIVSHDLAAYVDTVDEFLTRLGPGVSGTVETGAAIGWRLVAKAWPDTKFVVVRRNPAEVVASLAVFGLAISETDLQERLAAMEDMARQPGVLVLDYADLENPLACARLFEHCLDVPFDWAWWRSLAGENVQVDMAERIGHLAARHNKAAALRAEVANRLVNPKPFEWIGFEPWPAVFDEIVALAEQHYAEAEDVSRTFKPDVALFNKMAEALMLFVVCARECGRMIGYCIWTREVDTEAVGGLVFVQGPWYAQPGHAIGRRLFIWPFDRFREVGVTQLRLHHTLRGRGARLGGFFERLGAGEVKREYILPLEAFNA